MLDAMYDHLKPVLFTENSNILQEGDPIDMMLFIVRGRLIIRRWNNWNKDSFLKSGDFCGEELVPWSMGSYPIPLPISTRTITSLTKVEAFALEANELRSIASQFSRSSPDWRIWAAYKVQEAWHEYRQRKQKMGGGGGRFRVALAKTVGISASFGANLYASVFISHLLQAVQQDLHQETTQLSRAMTLPRSPKPDEQDYTILDL